MNDVEMQRRAAGAARELPGATSDRPFGPEWEVHRVGGKIFALLTELRERAVVIVKSDPVEALALREQYEAITPGFHMNKRHWITLSGHADVTEDLVVELVSESYLLVRASLRRDLRPALPDHLLTAADEARWAMGAGAVPRVSAAGTAAPAPVARRRPPAPTR